MTCTATDALQRTDSCKFSVTVTSPPKLSLTRFVAFGDSITWGEDGQNAPTSLSLGPVRPAVAVATPYPPGLKNLLVAAYPAQSLSFIVQNSGCRGEAAGDTASPCSGGSTVSRFGATVATGQFESVLLMEGANDLTNELAGDTSAEGNAIAALGSMIDTAKARQMRPYLATLTPENPYGTYPARRGGAANFVPPFNVKLASLASSKGIILVDVYAAFTSAYPDARTSPLIGSDGLHPTQQGYNLIAQTFFNTLKSTLETSASPTFMFSAPLSAPAHTGSFARPAAAGPASRPTAPRRQ